MTFPTIPTGGRVITGVNTGTSGTRTSPNLNTLTSPAGELIIAICIAYQGTGAATFSGWTNGFTEFGDTGGATAVCFGMAYKWSSGSETGTVSVTQVATVVGEAVWIIFSVPGAHATTPPAWGGYNSSAVAGTMADAASVNPTAWDVEDTLWVAVGGDGETSGTGSYTGISAAPANYTNLVTTAISADVVGGVQGAVAFRQLAAAAEDQGAWTADSSNARHAAVVIAIRPAAYVPQNYNETGRTVTIAVTASAGRLVAGSGTATFDAVGPSSAGAGGAGPPASPLTWSHVCSGNDRLLLVGVAFGYGNTTGLTVSATYNGVSMTQIGTVDSNNGTAGKAYLFGLLAPTPGTNTVAVTFSGGASDANSAIEAGSESFTSVTQASLAAAVTNLATAFGSGANPTVNVTSAVGNLVADLLVMGGTITSSADTQRWLKNVNGSTAGGNGAQATQVGAASVTMNYTAAAEFWGLLAVNIVGGSTTFVAGEVQHHIETGRTVSVAVTPIVGHHSPTLRVPPTLVGYQETTWMGNGAKSTPSIGWMAGDLILVLGLASSEFGDLPTPTISGGPTLTGDTPLDATGEPWANTWKGTAANESSAAVASTGETGSGAWGMAAWVFRNSEGFGGRVTLGSAAKVATLTKQASDSTVVGGVADYDAGPTGGYAFTPTPSNEREVQTNGINWTVFVADWLDTDTGGDQVFGITGTTSTGQHTKIMQEVLGQPAFVTGERYTPAAGGAFNETGRTVTIAGTVSATDVAHRSDLAKLVTAAGTVTATEVAHWSDLAKLVTAAVTVTAPGVQHYSELARLVSSAGTVTATGIQHLSELACPVSSSVTVLERDAYITFATPSYIDTGIADNGQGSNDTVQTAMPWLWKQNDLLILDLAQFGPNTVTILTDLAALGWAQAAGSPAVLNFGQSWRYTKNAGASESPPAVQFSSGQSSMGFITSIRNHNGIGDSTSTVTSVTDTTPVTVPDVVVITKSMLVVSYMNRYSAPPPGTHTPDADYTERVEYPHPVSSGATGVMSLSTRANLTAGTITGDTFATSIAARDAIIVTEILPPAVVYPETDRLVSSAVTVAAIDVQHDQELARLVTTATTVSRTDSIRLTEPLAVTTTVTVTKTELLHLGEVARPVTVAGTVTATDVQHDQELAKLAATTITVTATDSISGSANEVNRLVTIAATVTRTDVQAMKELDRPVAVAATVTAPSSLHAVELARLVPIAATATALGAQHQAELARLIAVAATVSTGLDRQAHKELTRSLASAVSVSATDVQYSSAQEFRTVSFAVTVTAVAGQTFGEVARTVTISTTVTAPGQLFVARDLGATALLLVTPTAAMLQRMAEARVVTLSVSASAIDVWQTALPPGAYIRPSSNVSTRPSGNIARSGGNGEVVSTHPSARITRRQL